MHGARTARFPAKTADGEQECLSPVRCRNKITPRFSRQRWERPPVTLTSRRRVRSPDWPRERRHAQKGVGREKEAGQGGGAWLVKSACVDGELREVGEIESEWRGEVSLMDVSLVRLPRFFAHLRSPVCSPGSTRVVVVGVVGEGAQSRVESPRASRADGTRATQKGSRDLLFFSFGDCVCLVCEASSAN